MTSDFHKKELEKLRQFLLFRKWETLYETADETRNYDRILVKIYAESEGERIFWPMELAFLPGLENDLKGFTLLQCYTPVVAGVPVNMETAIAVMTTRINTKLILGGFGLLASFHLLFYKFNSLIADTQIENAHNSIHESLSIASYLLSNFHKAFTDVATGKASVEGAMKAMPFHKLY